MRPALPERMETMNDKNRKRLMEQRRRKLLRIRLAQGFKQMVSRPYKAIPMLSVLVITNACSHYEFLEMTEGASPEMLAVSHAVAPVMAALLFAFLLFGAVMLAGIPREASRIWGKLHLALIMDGEFAAEDTPVLIARERISGTDAVWREFYSPGIPMSAWERHIDAIEHQLNCHLTEPLRYGGKDGSDRQRIIMVAAPGAAHKQRGELTDEL